MIANELIRSSGLKLDGDETFSWTRWIMSEACWNGVRGFLLLMRTMREFGFERREVGREKGLFIPSREEMGDFCIREFVKKIRT